MSPAISLTVLNCNNWGKQTLKLNLHCVLFLSCPFKCRCVDVKYVSTLDCVHVVSRGMHFNSVAPITDIMLLVVFFLGGVRLFCRVGFFAAFGKTAYLNDRHC